MDKVKYIFGLESQVANSVLFVSERLLVYTYGNHIVTYHLDQKIQKFIQISDKNVKITALAISSNKRFLAVAEVSETSDALISIFDLSTMRKRKSLVRSHMRPKSASAEEKESYSQLAFSSDSKYLAGLVALGGVELWVWERSKMEASMVVTNLQQKPIQVHSLLFSPSDSSFLTVTCHGYLKFLSLRDNRLTTTSSLKLQSAHFLSQAWLSEGVLVLGSDEGDLVFVEGEEVRNQRKVIVADTERKEIEDADKRIKNGSARSPLPFSVRHIVATSKGFLCSVGDKHIAQFERQERLQHRETKLFKLQAPDDITSAGEESIQQLIASPQEETIMCSSSHNLVYSAALSLASDLNQVEEGRLMMESHFHHSSAINDVSMCLRRPLVVTCGSDGCVKVWNYQNNRLELNSHFPEDVLSTSIHPTGFFLLVAFPSGLVVMTILVDELKATKQLPIKQSCKVSYSHGGHLFAVANGNQVAVYTSLTFQNVHNLKGHLGKVKTFAWSADDQRLVCCASAVYLWQVATEKKLGELVTRSCDYNDVCFSADEKSFVVVGDDMLVKEVADGQIVRTIDMTSSDGLTSVATIGRLLVVAAKDGRVSTIKYPLSQASLSHHPLHHCSVTKVVVSGDEEKVMSCGSDGGLVVSSLYSFHKTKEASSLSASSEVGHGSMVKKEVSFHDEVLVSRIDYNDKLLQTKELEQRLGDLLMEDEYKNRLMHATQQESLKQLTSSYEQQLQQLRDKLQASKVEKEKQQRWSEETKSELTKKHQDELQEQDAKSNHKLLLEYEKYQELQTKSQRMQEEYEARLVQTKKRSEQQLQTLTQQDSAQIALLRDKISQLEERVVECEREKEEMVREVEEDAEMEVTSVKVEMHACSEALSRENDKLKVQLGMITKKLVSLQRDVDGGKEEVARKEKEVVRLGEVIGNLEKEMLKMKKEMREREATVQEKERRIGELKRSNEELDKYRFVLQERLAQMQAEVAPQTDQLVSVNKHLTRMEEELSRKEEEQGRLQREVGALKNKVVAAEKETNVQKTKLAKTKTSLDRIKTDIHNAAALLHEPASLKEAVKQMHSKHLQSSEASISDEGDRLEWVRQRDHLERSVEAVSRKMQREVGSAQSDNSKMLDENVTLIEEVNKLRQELLLLKSKVGVLQTSCNRKQTSLKEIAPKKS